MLPHGSGAALTMSNWAAINFRLVKILLCCLVPFQLQLRLVRERPREMQRSSIGRLSYILYAVQPLTWWRLRSAYLKASPENAQTSEEKGRVSAVGTS